MDEDSEMPSTIPSISPNGVDKQKLRQSIGNMFKDLRNNVVKSSDVQARYLKWSAKPKTTESYSFSFSPLILDCGVNGGLPELKWDDSVIEKMHRGLIDKRVVVEVLGEDRTPSTPGSVPPSNKKPRIHDILRDRLLQTIENATGRQVIPRSGRRVHVDPRKSDPHPPNSYEWVFSEQYPYFPDTKGGISRWPAEDMRLCHEALDNGYLTATDVSRQQTDNVQHTLRQRRLDTQDHTDASQDDHNDQVEQNDHILDEEHEELDGQHEQDEDGNFPPPRDVLSESDHDDDIDDNDNEALPDPPTNTAESSNPAEVDPDVRGTLDTYKKELKDFEFDDSSPFKLNQFLVDFHRRMHEDTLHLALKKFGQELKYKWKLRYVTKEKELRREVEDLTSDLEARAQEVEEAQCKIQETQRELTKAQAEGQNLVLRLSEKDANAKYKLDRAREEGEEEGRREAMDDISATMESDMMALRRNHLEQVGNVRTQSYKQGYDAGLQAAPSLSPAQPPSTIADIEINLEAKRVLAFEQGRREGRELAYKELALSESDRVSVLLQNHTDLNKNRKIRELKTIHQNWADIPQNVLPPYMLPEGHTPGDKTLYLLARLSKEVDANKCGTLLAEEIRRRCQDSQSENISRIVTNADIQNVLNGMEQSDIRTRTVQPERPNRPEVSRAKTPIVKTPRGRTVSTPLTGRKLQPPKSTPRIASPTPRDDLPSPRTSTMPSLQAHFAAALQSWLDSAGLADRVPRNPAIQTALLNQPSTENKRLEDLVMNSSKSAGIAGKLYVTPQEVKTLKRYLAGLALELSLNFPFPEVSTAEDVVEVFKVIHSIFLSGNNVFMSLKKQNSSKVPVENQSAIIPTEGNEEQETQKRKRINDSATPTPTKRHMLAKSLPQRVEALRRKEVNERSSSVEVTGSIILVDTSPNAKEDEDDEGEENLYDATPPPKAKRRPRRSTAVS